MDFDISKITEIEGKQVGEGIVRVNQENAGKIGIKNHPGETLEFLFRSFAIGETVFCNAPDQDGNTDNVFVVVEIPEHPVTSFREGLGYQSFDASEIALGQRLADRIYVLSFWYD